MARSVNAFFASEYPILSNFTMDTDDFVASVPANGNWSCLVGQAYPTGWSLWSDPGSAYTEEYSYAWYVLKAYPPMRGYTDPELSVDAGSSPVLNAEFPNAPEFSANYLVRYALDLSDSSSLVFQLDGAYYGDQFLEVTNGQGTVQESYNVSNGSVTYEADAFSVSLWTKNMFDETYKAYSLDLGVLGATTYYAPPRTSGLTLKYNF